MDDSFFPVAVELARSNRWRDMPEIRAASSPKDPAEGRTALPADATGAAKYRTCRQIRLLDRQSAAAVSTLASGLRGATGDNPRRGHRDSEGIHKLLEHSSVDISRVEHGE